MGDKGPVWVSDGAPKRVINRVEVWGVRASVREGDNRKCGEPISDGAIDIDPPCGILRSPCLCRHRRFTKLDTERRPDDGDDETDDEDDRGGRGEAQLRHRRHGR